MFFLEKLFVKRRVFNCQPVSLVLVPVGRLYLVSYASPRPHALVQVEHEALKDIQKIQIFILFIISFLMSNHREHVVALLVDDLLLL